MGEQDPTLSTFQGSDFARALFDEAGDALLIVDPASERLLDANPLAQKLTRLNRDALLQMSLRELLRHEQGAEEWLKAVRLTDTFHGQDDFLLRTKQPDGWVPVSVTIARLHPSGAEPLALFTIRDQSEQMAAFRRLQRTEAELRRVLISVSDCLWSCRVEPDGSWHYRYLSPVVERITGLSVSVFLEDPQAWAAVVQSEDLPRWRDFITQVGNGRGGELEYRIRRGDSTVIWVRESVTAAVESGGSLLLHGVVADITARRRAEQVKLENRLLETQKLESLGVLAGGIAHDFNNLLTGILGNASLARLSGPPTAEAAEHLGQIETIAARAADLCRQMLAYAGKAPFLAGPLDLNAVIQETIDLLRLSISKRALLTFELAPDLPLAQADATQVRQVLLNLVMNASEALDPDGGLIRLATGAAQLEGEALSALTLPDDVSAGRYVWMEVSDNGPGITAQVQARMFEPFYTTKFTGRGLGLAVVLGIVRGHKGAIQVRSEPGRVTSVRIYLPRVA